MAPLGRNGRNGDGFRHGGASQECAFCGSLFARLIGRAPVLRSRLAGALLQTAAENGAGGCVKGTMRPACIGHRTLRAAVLAPCVRCPLHEASPSGAAACGGTVTPMRPPCRPAHAVSLRRRRMIRNSIKQRRINWSFFLIIMATAKKLSFDENREPPHCRPCWRRACAGGGRTWWRFRTVGVCQEIRPSRNRPAFAWLAECEKAGQDCYLCADTPSVAAAHCGVFGFRFARLLRARVFIFG